MARWGGKSIIQMKRLGNTIRKLLAEGGEYGEPKLY